MERYDKAQREHNMLKYINTLPRRIVQLHGTHNVTEFVLHDMCQERCLNFNKAAYFIDNPAFNCTQGIAGFARQEAFGQADSIWDEPTVFTQHMQQSPFNQKVRQLSHQSLLHTDEGHKKLAAELAQDLGYTNHDYCTWPLKHDNHGVIVYEKADTDDELSHDQIVDSLHLLSFCPVF